LTYITQGFFRLTIPANKASLTATWLRDLSDGFVIFDEDEPALAWPNSGIASEEETIVLFW
jgi:hypothetical protein